MNENRKKINPLIKSSIVYIFSTIIGQGMSFLGILVFTRLMNQADYGEYSTYYAYVSIFTVLIGANLYYSLNNAYIDLKDEIEAYRKSVLTLSVFIMLAITGIMIFLGCMAVGKFSLFIILMAALHSYGFFVITYRTYSANMENDYKKKRWLLILPNTFQFTVALLLVLMMPGMAFEARVIGSTLGIGGVAAVCFTGILRSKGPFIQTNYWKYAFSISLPTIVMSLSYMMMQQCDKVMIRNICGPEDTAVYAVIYYLGFAMIAVDQAAAPVRQAWIFHHLDNQDFTTTKIIQKWYLIIMCIIAVGLIMTGPEIVKIIAPRTYWKYEYITPFVLSACMMVLYRFNVEVILFYKSNNSLSISVLVCALLNITLNALFIPAFGAVTACYTTVVSYGLLFVLTWFLANRHIQGIYEWKYFMFFIMATIGSAISFMTISDKALLRYVFLVLLLICTIVYTIHSRGEWSTVLWNRK